MRVDLRVAKGSDFLAQNTFIHAYTTMQESENTGSRIGRRTNRVETLEKVLHESTVKDVNGTQSFV